jgi:hypothetical protein
MYKKKEFPIFKNTLSQCLSKNQVIVKFVRY